MYGNASDLVAFRLMPLEPRFHKKVEAQWSFQVIDRTRSAVAFQGVSYGNITAWHWGFGDGKSSSERRPIHLYEKPGEYIVSLDVEGPDGKDRRTRTLAEAITRPV